MIPLAIFVIIVVGFWLLFSDSIIKMWDNYFQVIENKRQAIKQAIKRTVAEAAILAERKANPPSCADCKWIEFFQYRENSRDVALAKCTNPKARYKYCNSERDSTYEDVCG